VDFLCYGLPDEPTPDLARALHAYHVWQQEADVARQWGIQALGFDFTERHHRDLIESYRPPKTLMVQGYTHARNGTMREELIRRGIIRTEEEYAPLLRRAAEVVPFPPYPPAEQVLPAVRACGARVAIAHPFHYFQGTDIGRMDALRAEFGLDGIECAHRTVPAEMTPIYREYCLRHGLFSVGGSDAHTPDDLRNLFGHHLGEDSWLAADGPAAFPLHFRSGARLE
jgi:predicted metal-dependent phosphoesterase TrpH